jgi:hypothetical protein
MSQVTIYLDDDTEKRARAAADASGDSLSKWISGAIREKTATTWPQHVLDLAGSWPDFPLAEELRKGQKGDERRERF